MALIGDIVAEVRLELSRLAQDHKKAVKMFKGVSKSIVQITKKMAVATGAAMVGVGIASVKLASDMEETQAKFDTAFSGITKKAEETAKALSKGYLMSSLESKKLLSNTGDLLKGFGFTADNALNLSNRVQQISADLASYNNLQGGTARASKIVTKAIMGNKDGLTELGVSILDSDIKARMLDNGMAGLTGTARTSAKAMATFELILEQTGDAMGDISRTSDSFANRIKYLKARSVDLGKTLGKALLPVALKIANALIDMVNKSMPWIEKMSRKMETLVDMGLARSFDKLVVKPLKSMLLGLKLYFYNIMRDIIGSLSDLGRIEIFGKKMNVSGLDGLIEKVDGIIKSTKELQNTYDALSFIPEKQASQEGKGGAKESVIFGNDLSTEWRLFYFNVGESVKRMGKQFKATLEKTNTNIKKYIGELGGEFGRAKDGGSGTAGAAGQVAFKVLSDGASKAYAGVKKLAGALTGAVMEAAGAVGEGLVRIFSGDILGGLMQILGESDQFKAFMEKIAPIMAEIANIVGAVLVPILELLLPFLELFVDVLKVVAKVTMKTSIFVLKGIKPILKGFEWLINGIIKMVNKLPFVNIKEVKMVDALDKTLKGLEDGIKSLDENNRAGDTKIVEAVDKVNQNLFNLGAVNTDVMRARALQGIGVNVSIDDNTSSQFRTSVAQTKYVSPLTGV